MEGLFQRLTFLDTLRMVPLRFSMAFVVARDWRSKGGRRELHDRECFFHPFTKASGSFVVAVSLEPRHQCLKSLARLVGTLALVGFLHRLEHVGRDETWEGTSEDFGVYGSGTFG